MKLKNFVFVVAIILLSGLNAQASCYWVKVNDDFAECRTPLNRVALNQESRTQILQTVLQNSQNYLNRIFNNSQVLDIVTGGQPLDNRLVEKARAELAQSEETVELLNQLTSIAEAVQAPDDMSPSLMPAALIFGVTISTPKGIPVPSPIASAFRSSGSLTIGGGSVLMAVVSVPYVVEFLAEKMDEDDTNTINPLTVYRDRSTGVRVYRTDLPFYQRFGVESGLRLFPNLDLRVSEKGVASQLYKTSNSLINLGAAWGSTILRPDDLGAWGLSYTQPTSSKTLTPGFSSLYSNTLMKRLEPLANFSLATLNRFGVETLKVSLNSRSEFWARDFKYFDQTIALLRWPSNSDRVSEDLNPTGRLGVNVGMDLLDSLNVFGNVILSVERAEEQIKSEQGEEESQLNLDQQRMQLQLRQAGVDQTPTESDATLPSAPPLD